MKALLGRLSYANVIATMALFIALGGVGYAATALPKNSVRTKQLAKNSVTSPKVKDGTLGRSDLAPGVIPNAVDTSNFYDKSAADARFYDKGASDARFLGTRATADNSEKLNSFPGSSYPISIRDDNQLADGDIPRLGFARRSIAAGAGPTTILGIGLVGEITVGCGDPAAPSISYRNTQQIVEDVWTQNMISGALTYASVGEESATVAVLGSGAVQGASRFQFIVGSGATSTGGIAAVFDVTTVTAPGGVSDNSCLVQVQSQSLVSG